MSSAAAELLLKVKTVGDEAIDKLSDKFGMLGGIATAAFAAISAVVVKSLLDYREQEEATNRLTQAMVNQGIYSKGLKDAYVEQASALQKLSLYGDEQIIGAEATLQSYLGQTKVTKELVTATLDLATAKKIDLSQAADMVGKAIGTNTNALARNGIEVTSNASQAQKLGEVMAGLNKHFEGQAEAATKGLGSVTQLTNVMSDMYETIGERLSPVVELFARQLINLGNDTNQTTPALDAFVFVIKSLVMSGVIVQGVLQGVADILTNTLGSVVRSMAELVQGHFVNAFAIMKDGVKGNLDAVVTNTESTFDKLKQVDDAFLISKQENVAAEAALVATSNANTAAVNAEFQASENNKKLERAIEQQNIEMGLIGLFGEQLATAKINAKIKEQEALLKLTTDDLKKQEILRSIFHLNEQKAQAMQDEANIANRKSTFGIIAGLSSSHNSALANIGKAAAITQIAIETPVAIAKALSAFPPPFNFAAAGLVGAAMAAQAANIAGVQLAEGGIVMPRPGGIQATIGEAGQAEAVIPLDRMGEMGMGGGGQVTVNFNGPVMGDESQAHTFALAIDKELLKLRRNNESVSFDSGVI